MNWEDVVLITALAGLLYVCVEELAREWMNDDE